MMITQLAPETQEKHFFLFFLVLKKQINAKVHSRIFEAVSAMSESWV